MEDRQKRLAREAAMRPNPKDAREDVWKQLSGDLDDLVDTLRARDREAILLRFYEHKSHEEIGSALGLTKEAARKRVDRALLQLQGLFASVGSSPSAPASSVASVTSSEVKPG